MAFILDDLALAAAVEAAVPAVAGGASAVAGAAGTVGAINAGAGVTPALTAGAGGASGVSGAAGGAFALPEIDAGLDVALGGPGAQSIGDIGLDEALGGTFGGPVSKGSPLLKPSGIKASDVGKASPLEGAAEFRSQMKTAGKMLGLAGKFIPNKQAKGTLDLMSMTSLAAANAEDPKSLISDLREPLTDLASTVEQPKDQRLSQAIPPPAVQAPSTTEQPVGGPVSQNAPSASNAAKVLPSTRLTSDATVLTPEQRLRMLRSFQS